MSLAREVRNFSLQEPAESWKNQCFPVPILCISGRLVYFCAFAAVCAFLFGVTLSKASAQSNFPKVIPERTVPVPTDSPLVLDPFSSAAQTVRSDQTVRSVREEPPIVWFVHGMAVVWESYEPELKLLREIFPEAEFVALKAWNAPHGPTLTFEELWKKSVFYAEQYAQMLADEIALLPQSVRDRLILVGHSLGGRIVVRALAKVHREKGLEIRQFILAGAALNYDDSDIQEAVLASKLTAYSLVNPADAALKAYQIAEKRTAAGTACLWTFEPSEFYEIALSNTLEHFPLPYLERLWECVQADDFTNPEILIPQVSNPVPIPPLPGGSWTSFDECMGWRFQKNAHETSRIIDPRNGVLLSGSHDEVLPAFQRVKSQLRERQSVSIPDDSIYFSQSVPVVNFSTLGSDGWWFTMETFNSWELQKSRSTDKFRILDPQKRRRACGGEREMKDAFAELKRKSL